MKINGAIFDADGTLFDSMHIWENLGESYIKSKGFEPGENFRDEVLGMSLKQSIKHILSKFSIDDTEENVLNDLIKLTEDSYHNAVKVKDGVPEFLEFLKSKNVKMCIATSAERKMVEGALKNNNINEYFNFILTSTEVGIGKKSPTIYNLALEKLNTDKNKTVVFEDAAHAAATAKKAGFNVCGIYDKFEKNQAELKENVELYIISYNEAKKFFE